MNIGNNPSHRIEYEKSSEKTEDNRHIFKSFNENGNISCIAKLEYLSSPERMFMLRWISKETGFEDKKGVATTLLKKVNEFLLEKKMPGVLSSAMRHWDFYRKNGWVQYNNSTMFFFGYITEENKVIAMNRIYLKLKQMSG